ncbi:MAG: transposase, partial [Candidatus Atribacteria bacterium]|nr:transposase [Candidatus Atribacteria bacterium]
MARRNRTETEDKNAIYHIIVKGMQGIDIFTDNTDKNKFLQLLQKMITPYKIQFFSYVLMNTHFHLLLKTEEANLSQAMQFLNSSYAHWFNCRHIRKGHLFQDRYKSHLILSPLYLYNVASYISLNPVEAGIVNSPEEYKWSSFKYYASASSPSPSHLPNNSPPSWLKIEEFLIFCETNAYEFTNFVKENMRNKDVEKSLRELSQTKNKFPKNIESILEKINLHLGDIKTNKNLRNLLIYLLVKKGYRIKEISNFLNLTKQAVFKISKKTEKDLT